MEKQINPEANPPSGNDTEILEGYMVFGKEVEEPLRIKPTERPCVYDTPNGILITRYIRISELQDWPVLPVDRC
jgi:hypothetical protein